MFLYSSPQKITVLQKNRKRATINDTNRTKNTKYTVLFSGFVREAPSARHIVGCLPNVTPSSAVRSLKYVL